jgi:homogentisate phytyltransferase/homogentisate geranylgeranyltransferase
VYRFVLLLVRFGRPHTLVGTTLSVAGLYVILLAERHSGPNPGHLAPLLLCWIAAIAANIFIVGLNQLTDVEIDRINKPELPIAAGEMSLATGRRAVWAALGASLFAAALVGPALVATVAISMAIGAAYSLPPLRLKRFALWAAGSIAAVRGVLVNLGVYAALSAALFGGSATGSEFPPQLLLLAAFVAVFSVAIAVAKDVPDVGGDRSHAIETLAVRIGPGAAFRRARALLSLAYVMVVVLAIAGVPGVNNAVLATSHLGLLALFWWRTARIDAADVGEIRSAYALVWRLFYSEYIVFPAACLLA